MERKLNLLPDELAVKKTTVKLAKALEKLSFIGVAVAIGAAVILISLVILFGSQLKKSQDKVAVIKERIVSLKESEQKLILAKDKLSKVAIISKYESANDEVIIFREVSDILSYESGTTISETTIKSTSLETGISSSSSSSLSYILSALEGLTGVSKIFISDLTFNSQSGYQSNVVFEKGETQ